MTVWDNKIQAKGSGFPSKNLRKKGPNASRKLTKDVLQNFRGELRKLGLTLVLQFQHESLKQLCQACPK